MSFRSKLISNDESVLYFKENQVYIKMYVRTSLINLYQLL